MYTLVPTACSDTVCSAAHTFSHTLMQSAEKNWQFCMNLVFMQNRESIGLTAEYLNLWSYQKWHKLGPCPVLSVCGGSVENGSKKEAGELFLRPPAVGIVCLVVHDQLVVHKVEAVRLRLVRVKDHLAHWETREKHTLASLSPVRSDVCVHVHVSALWTLTDLLRQRRELVDVLACVLAAWHAEAKFKIEALEQLITEVMSLNHAEVVDGRLPHCELHSADMPWMHKKPDRNVIKGKNTCPCTQNMLTISCCNYSITFRQ